MYKPTIWQDHVEGVQEGTDMNAKNFNNMEAGVMEAAALAALNAENSRHAKDKIDQSADYIIEQGEKNGWGYRKWASGFAECWGRFHATKSEYSDRVGVVHVDLPFSLLKESILLVSGTQHNSPLSYCLGSFFTGTSTIAEKAHAYLQCTDEITEERYCTFCLNAEGRYK